MADFGELKEFIEPNVITFTFNGEKYTINPTAKIGLKFINDFREATKGDGLTNNAVYSLGANLMGGEYDPKANEFTGGLVPQLIEDGIDLEALHHILYTSVLHFYFGEQVSEIYYKTGDMNKALGLEDEDPKKTKTDQTGQKSETD